MKFKERKKETKKHIQFLVENNFVFSFKELKIEIQMHAHTQVPEQI